MVRTAFLKCGVVSYHRRESLENIIFEGAARIADPMPSESARPYLSLELYSSTVLKGLFSAHQKVENR